jgi:peptidoglycan/LPS O-acetylase OafA/YrhL
MTTETVARTPPAVQPAPTPPRQRFAYHASLDGLRALAMLAIFAYHLDYAWAGGAYLSVDLFFILSGFLITTLLIVEWRRSETIRLARFWLRRARRLLPALMLVLILVAIYTRVVVDPWTRPALRGDGLASFFYVANWRFIAEHQGYFELFSAPSPLRHMWTLAIEEQFYLVWPLVVLGVFKLTRGSLRALAAVCAIGVAISVTIMATVYGPGDPLRAYYGTDARMHTILMGALLAILLSVWTPSTAAAKRIAVVSIGAFVAMLFAWYAATGTSPRYYYGGSVLYAALACVVIAGALQVGPLRALLGIAPLAWIGRLSYGLYLFHWPIIVWLVPSRVHIDGFALDALRVILTFTAATISFYLIELPIREGRRPTLPWKRTEVFDTGTVHAKRSVMRWLALPLAAISLTIVVTSASGATPPPSYMTGVKPPKADFIWNYGDPLYCGEPESAEMRDATAQARELGKPELERPARGVRILLLGDSTACSFYPGLKAVGQEVGAQVQQASVFGCGMASGHITTTRGEQITPNSQRCPEMVHDFQVPAIAATRPDIVIWMSLWEKSDIVKDGKTLVSGTRAGDAEMLRRMDAELKRITKYGAKVALLTIPPPAPNEAEGTTNDSTREVDVASYARLDRIQRRFAARHPDSVVLVDLARRVCPGGAPCPEEVRGVRLRPDGRHFTPVAGAIEARWLMRQLMGQRFWG